MNQHNHNFLQKREHLVPKPLIFSLFFSLNRAHILMESSKCLESPGEIIDLKVILEKLKISIVCPTFTTKDETLSIIIYEGKESFNSFPSNGVILDVVP